MLSEVPELGRGARRVPLRQIAARPAARDAPRRRVRVAQLLLEPEQVVASGLDPHEQAVEGGDVYPHGVVSRLERLHERRPGPRERIEHASPVSHVPREQRLDELRDELPEIGV